MNYSGLRHPKEDARLDPILKTIDAISPWVIFENFPAVDVPSSADAVQGLQLVLVTTVGLLRIGQPDSA